MRTFWRRLATLQAALKNDSTISDLAATHHGISKTSSIETSHSKRWHHLSLALSLVGGSALLIHTEIYPLAPFPVAQARIWGPKEKPQDTGIVLTPPECGPWVTDNELREEQKRRKWVTESVLTERRRREYELRRWADWQRSEKMYNKEEYIDRYEDLKEEVDKYERNLFFGDESGYERFLEFFDKYGYVLWTDSALRVIERFAPVLELLAHTNSWAAELKKRGVEIESYSQTYQDRSLRPVVEYGDLQQVMSHPHHTLLLIAPPDNDDAVRCLRRYRGDVLLYIGESRGGMNANDEFFDLLERSWDCLHSEPLSPYKGYCPRLWVLRRKISRTPVEHSAAGPLLPEKWPAGF